MSGDCTKEPVIFYTEEMTESKIMLLELHGIKFRNKYYSNSAIDIEDLQRISRRKQFKQNQV